MKFCIECGHNLDNSQEFCTECGVKQPIEQLQAATATKNKQVETSQSIKKKPSKKGVILFFVGLFLIAGGFIAYKMGERLTGPSAVVADFNEAVKTKDIEQVMKTINMGQTQSKVDKATTESFVNYLNKNEKLLADSIKELEETGEMLKNSHVNANNDDDVKNSFFTIKQSGKKWFIFDKYIIEAKPFMVKVRTNYDDSTVFLNEESKGTYSEEELFEIGPLLPGEHKVKVSYKGKYSTLENTVNLDFSEAYNNELEVDVEVEGDYITVYSNYEDSNLFINGKDSGLLVEDAYDVGPFATDGSVTLHAEKMFDGNNMKSEEYTITSGGDVDLDFDYEEPEYEYDYEEEDDNLSLFMQDYIEQYVMAINENDFSIVEDYLDSEGPAYKENKDYVEFMNYKGYTEEVFDVTVENVEWIDDSTLEVNTYEEYEIFYDEESSEYQNFNSSYLIKVDGDEYLVNKLLNTTEVGGE